MLEIYNSESRRKETFTPVDPAGERVGMYYCGTTILARAWPRCRLS
ncbi:MAG: hypothetical protein AAFX50_25375 [Acidobacteriota bacterium]